MPSTNLKFDDWVRAGLAIIVVGTFSFAIIYGQVTGKQMPNDEFTVYVGMATMALGFYLGASSATNQKAKEIPPV